MLLFLFSIVMATAAGVTAFLIIVSDDFSKFREAFLAPKLPQLPLITMDGEVIDTREELDAQLDILQYKLEKKKSELEGSKSRICTAAESLQKLTTTSAEIRKYFLRLTNEVKRSEKDLKVLEEQINDYKQRKEQLDQVFGEKGEDAIPNNCNVLLNNLTAFSVTPDSSRGNLSA